MIVSGRITQWENGTEKSLSGAIVVVAMPGTWLDTSKMYDVVRGPIAGKTVTQDNGTFSLNTPAGNYNVILWKTHYIPSTDNGSSPGNYNGSISRDTQVGWPGRHIRLEFAD